MPKKILSLAFVLISLSFVWSINSQPLFNGFGDRYEVYLKSNSSQAQIVSTLPQKVWLYFQRYGEACIISGVTKNNANPQNIIEDLGGEIIFIEETKEGTSYYGYSKNINYSQQIKGEKINLHLFVCGEYCKIGSPIIYGSY